MTELSPRAIRLGREACGALDQSQRLEWLVTNGIGGYASGTVAGVRTRRYHALLVAALDPPGERVVLAAEVHEALDCGDGPTPLHASRWRDGSVSPRGFEHIEAFWLEGGVPVWRFCVGHVCLEKRVTMARGRNATVVAYRLVRASAPVHLAVKVLAVHRDFHGNTRAGASPMSVEDTGDGIVVAPRAGGRPLYIRSPSMVVAPTHVWYEGFLFDRERERGLDPLDDALHVATATVDLRPGADAGLVLAAESGDFDPEEVFAEVRRHEADVVARYHARQGVRADPIGARLALAADQFLVRRGHGGDEAWSIIAGYHWFGEWGRDTMIALPGLALVTGRSDVARHVLQTYAGFVDGGMLPNRLPDGGSPPEYNTVDATLWYLEAIRAYTVTTGDLGVARTLWPVLEGIIAAHERGTRYGIRMDPRDGLLRSGQTGVQLTWMDAKLGDWVVTPREGKCVEVNALWYNGLAAMADLAVRLGHDAATWTERVERTRSGMQRFWSEHRGYLIDVLDGPSGNDECLRPNQILAVALAFSAFGDREQRAAVDACARALLTSHGLRSLAPDQEGYRPHYEGDVASRDGAYHQGTVWAWLLGPFALAHFRVYHEMDTARALLDPLLDHLHSHGLGSIAEIFDGAPPHWPRGCIAQA
ncbi:MAG: glycogen debranching enzyme family protein, partial [Gemmatimonadota bacterium]|nr:glycogen debranching enzyme family protein [Gemmatimonadota bacterium]